jgi:hypothetical protein
MLSFNLIFKIISALFLFIIFFAGSCEDGDPIAPQEEHFDAVGIRITQSGVLILDYFAPDYPAGTTTISDTVFLNQGINPKMEANFYDENKNIIAPPNNSEISFGAQFTDNTIAEIWWHAGEEGTFDDFHLKGLKNGSTTFKFQVLHAGHADFQTLQIPVVVDTLVLHGEPVGVRLYDENSGSLLAEANLAADGTVSGSIVINNGTSTDHIEAIFFDEENIEFSPPTPEHSLQVASSQISIASITGIEPDEPWAFKVQANSAGSCTITLSILHNGTAEETFAPIPVIVN